MKNIPALDSKVLDLVTEISKEPKVEAAMAFIKDQTEVAMQEQIELCEIEAPTFHEEKRAASVAERMKQYGLTDVHIDEIGNVIGIRKGTGAVRFSPSARIWTLCSRPVPTSKSKKKAISIAPPASVITVPA